MEFAIYLSQKWSDCHGTKSKHIDWTLGLKCDHRAWPWPWPWPWIFKVKYRICYISAKNGPIATKQKANISIEVIELKASNVTIRFDLGHDLDLEFSRSNIEFPISQPKVVWLPWNEKQTFRLNYRPQMWPMGFWEQNDRSFRKFVCSGLSPDILKMGSWTHMGRTANIIIKDVIHIFSSISKIMRISLMGRHNHERCAIIDIIALKFLPCMRPSFEGPRRHGLHPLHPDRLTVPTVSQSQPSALSNCYMIWSRYWYYPILIQGIEMTLLTILLIDTCIQYLREK